MDTLGSTRRSREIMKNMSILQALTIPDSITPDQAKVFKELSWKWQLEVLLVDAKGPGLNLSVLYISVLQGRLDRGGYI